MHRMLEHQTQCLLREYPIYSAQWKLFLAAVDDAYSSADAERQKAESALARMAEDLAGLRADLAQRRLAECQLENLLSLLGATLESTADGIMVLDKDGRLARFNQRFIEMWRVTDDVAAFWEHGRIMACIRAQLARGEDLMLRVDYLSHHPREASLDLLECLDGRLIECYSPPHPEGVDAVSRVFSFRDITERKRAEAALHAEKEEQKALVKKLETAHNQLLQSEKMASIGQLAAGVAHEINNPIGYVNSNLGSLGQYVEKIIQVVDAYERAEPGLAHPALLGEIHALKREMDWDYLKQDIRDLLRESAEGIARVRQIVQDLKDFSHVDQGEWQWVDLHKGLDSTLNIVHNEIKYNADVVKAYGALPPVECLASQLNQVFMNLLVNASHAIGEGGRGKITLRTGTKGDNAWIEFSDTGKGIAPENLKRIFDPFFTTKPVGKGTGLGLSLSFGIIEKHGGHIEVESEPGSGATFRLWLPIRQKGAICGDAGSISAR